MFPLQWLAFRSLGSLLEEDPYAQERLEKTALLDQRALLWLFLIVLLFSGNTTSSSRLRTSCVFYASKGLSRVYPSSFCRRLLPSCAPEHVQRRFRCRSFLHADRFGERANFLVSWSITEPCLWASETCVILLLYALIALM